MSRYNSEWDKITLSDSNTIKGLLRFRYKFDLLLDNSENRYGLESNCDLANFSEDVICIYADLDNLIKQANFNEYQKKVLNMYMYGHSEEDIADLLDVERQSINRLIDNICRMLCEINYQNWKLNYVFWDVKRVNSNYKKCSKCKEWLPATEEYFSPDLRNNDNLQGICKKCNTNRMKSKYSSKISC